MFLILWFLLSPSFYLGHNSISHMTLKRDRLLIFLQPGVVPIDFPPGHWPLMGYYWSPKFEFHMIQRQWGLSSVCIFSVTRDTFLESGLLLGVVTLCAAASLNPRKNCFQVLFIEVHILSTPEFVGGMAHVKFNINKGPESNSKKYKCEVLHVGSDILLHEYQTCVD